MCLSDHLFYACCTLFCDYDMVLAPYCHFLSILTLTCRQENLISNSITTIYLSEPSKQCMFIPQVISGDEVVCPEHVIMTNEIKGTVIQNL